METSVTHPNVFHPDWSTELGHFHAKTSFRVVVKVLPHVHVVFQTVEKSAVHLNPYSYVRVRDPHTPTEGRITFHYSHFRTKEIVEILLSPPRVPRMMLCTKKTKPLDVNFGSIRGLASLWSTIQEGMTRFVARNLDIFMGTYSQEPTQLRLLAIRHLLRVVLMVRQE